MLGQVRAALAETEIETGRATLRGTMPTRIIQQVQRQLPDLTGGAAVLETGFDHFAPVAEPRHRPRSGPDPFDRDAYLAKLRL